MPKSPLANQTPGVYINEISAFPNSNIEVATAIPAFVGYTSQASYGGKSCINSPVKISSFQEFKAIFVLPDPPAPAAQNYPQYYVIQQKNAPDKGKYYHLNGDVYTVEPDPGTIYYLYNSVKLFFENGGREAYVISVGGYGVPTGSPIDPGCQIQNPNVKLADLMGGIKELKKQSEVTIYVVPEATLLKQEDNGRLMEAMLLQCGDMGTTISLFDIIGGRNPDPILYTQDIQEFRDKTGNNDLDRGAAYYPFLNTTITDSGEVDYTNLNGGDTSVLADIVNPPSMPNVLAAQILREIQNPTKGKTASQLNQALMDSSTQYNQLMGIVLHEINVQPTSGVMAGLFALVDNIKGVWHAPSNISPAGVVGVTLDINDSMQAGLIADAIGGKSINAIRFFIGQGIMIWGARTLDGFSQDWRYISVRRTVTMIEQSVKLAAQAYVFAANDANTWSSVKVMIENFLTNIWKQGALQGAKAADAFNVVVGLGSTMTAEDILEGRMIVSVKLAVTHPAEFMIIQVEQEMATA